MSVVDPLSTSSEVLQQEPEKSVGFPILEILRSMDPHVWHKVAAVSGVAAVGLGAYGSHVEELGIQRCLANSSLVPFDSLCSVAFSAYGQTTIHFWRTVDYWNISLLWNVLCGSRA